MQELSIRENYLLAAHGEKPQWIPSFVEDCNVLMPSFWEAIDPETDTDFMNVKWTADEFGKMPRGDWHAMEEVSEWRETVKFPDVAAFDWEGAVAEVMANGSPDKINMGMINTNGLFLVPINMLGWEEGLCSLYTDPDELEAFISRIADFLIEIVRYEGEYFHPDIMVTGDDFASTCGPFISREVFQERYKPYLKKVNDAIHEQGALVEFHTCGNCQWLIDEYIEIGADIIQLPMPNDALMESKKKYGKRLVMTGGWDRHGKGAEMGASEEVVRQSVRTAIDDFGKEGGLIFWDGGICGNGEDAKKKMEWVMDELHTYGRSVYRD